jgi:PAS domain S-box-containing protein
MVESNSVERLLKRIDTLEEEIRQLKEKQKEKYRSDLDYRTLLENMNDGMGILGADKRMKYANRKLCQMLGYSADEIYEMNVEKLYDEKNLKIVIEEFSKRFEGGNHPYEVEWTKKDGTKVATYMSPQPLFSENGDFEGSFAVITDISPLKQAKEELKQEKDFTENLLETANSLVVTLDKDANIMIFNKCAERLTGYSKREVLGKNWFDIFIPEYDKQNIPTVFMETLKQRPEVSIFENPIVTKDGTERLIGWSNSTLKQKGKIIGVLSIGKDITEQRRLEEEEKRLSHLLENIFNSMPSVLMGVDEWGKITQWNRQAEIQCGIAADDARGRRFEELLPQSTEILAGVQEALKKRRPMVNNNVIRQRKGEVHYEDITVYPLVADGVNGAVIRIDDVTERMRLEEMMIQSEKMVTVGGLAAGMAHEINNPLAAIIQSAEVVENRLAEDLPVNRRVAEEVGISFDAVVQYTKKRKIDGMLENIRSSGARAATIVRNMLEFTRKSDSAMFPCSIPELLDKSLELVKNDYSLKKKYDFKQIEILREYESNIPEVVCHPGKIQQVFLNILKNGADAMSEKAKGDFKPRFCLRIMAVGASVKIEIEDNGPGIDKYTRKRIFEPFFTTKSIGKGTGLGMSISYFIITKNHCGKLSVESQEGEWTTFIIELPVEQPKSEDISR